MKKILAVLILFISAPVVFSAQQTLTTEKVASWMSKANANFTDLYTNKQNLVTGTCGAGQAVQAIAADGTVTCGAAGASDAAYGSSWDGDIGAATNRRLIVFLQRCSGTCDMRYVAS